MEFDANKSKYCKFCQVEHPMTNEWWYKDGKYGKCKKKSKAHYEANRPQILENMKAHYEANRPQILENKKAYREANKPKIREIHKAYYEANKPKTAEYNKSRYEANKPKILENNKAYEKERLQTDPRFKYIKTCRHRTWFAYQSRGLKKTDHSIKLLGCTTEELRLHLEKQFQPGMTHENHGLWHIDHIRPIASFSDEELHLAFHYTNLQPLWAEENILKSAKWDG